MGKAGAMVKNILFLMGIGGFFVVSDTAAMLRGLQLFKVNHRLSVNRRFLSVLPNDPIKRFSVSPLCDAQTSEGNTALHIVVLSCPVDKKKEVLHAVFEGLPNPFIENNKNKTARQEAESLNYPELAKELEMWEEAYYSDFSDIAKKFLK